MLTHESFETLDRLWKELNAYLDGVGPMPSMDSILLLLLDLHQRMNRKERGIP